jgi:hypothetical protein
VSVMALAGRPVVGGMVAAPTALGAPKSGRVRVLTEIAERYGELLDPASGPSGVRGDGGSLGLTRHESRCLLLERADVRRRLDGWRRPECTCAYRSVVEFERLVVRLREERRPLWWHLDGWWLSASTRTVHHCPRCGITHQAEHRHPNRRSGRMSTVKCKRVVAWSRRAGAQESSAREAIAVMADWWGLDSEPMLPDEIRVVA